MKDQLLELFEGLIFQFEIRCDNIITYKSVTPLDMDGCYCHFTVDIFDNGKDLFLFETFEDLTYKTKIFEVVKFPIISNSKKEVLFHQKFDEDEFYQSLTTPRKSKRRNSNHSK